MKHDYIYGLALVVYIAELCYKFRYQLIQKSAYVTRNKGHNINDLILKPTRMLIVLMFAYKLGQIAWLLSFGIIFCKWILTRPYEEMFDVPNWFHGILVTFSILLVLVIYPLDIVRVIQPDNLKTFLSTVPQVYVAYVGLLGVFLGAILVENKAEISKVRYVTSGFILNFVFVSILVLLCLIGLLSFICNEPLNMSATYLFTENQKLTPDNLKKYILWGVTFPLAWFIFPFTIMSALLMLIDAGKIFPHFLENLKK